MEPILLMPKPRKIDGQPALESLIIIRYLYIDVTIEGKRLRFRQNFDGSGSWMKWIDGYWTMPAPHEEVAINQVLTNSDDWKELDATRDTDAVPGGDSRGATT